VVNFILMGFAKFGAYSVVTATLTIGLVGLAILFYVFDGWQYVQRCIAWYQKRRKVHPIDLLYLDEEEKDDSSERKSNAGEEEGKEFQEQSTAVVPVYIKEASTPPRSVKYDQSVRAGLFEKEVRVKLKEGQWRVIKRRVTQIRALRGISEMNRKFNIEKPVDEEVMTYDHSDDDSSDEDSPSPNKLEISPRKKAHREFFARSKVSAYAAEDEEFGGHSGDDGHNVPAGNKALEYITRKPRPF
jgi:hypothetical protein